MRLVDAYTFVAWRIGTKGAIGRLIRDVALMSIQQLSPAVVDFLAVLIILRPDIQHVNVIVAFLRWALWRWGRRQSNVSETG